MTAKPIGMLGGLVAVVGMALSLDANAQGSAEQTVTLTIADEGGDDQPGRQDRKRMTAPYQDGSEQSV